jgi:hypothetical protein
VKVTLFKKLAEKLNGFDLSKARTGDVLDVSPRDGAMLSAGGWATEVDQATGATAPHGVNPDASAAASSTRPRR